MSLETLTKEAFDAVADKTKELADEPIDEKDPAKLRQRKPPVGGMCRRCGENKPINRLMLCYPCWVKSNLERDGWREGMPHPDECGCEGLKDHTRKSDGN